MKNISNGPSKPSFKLPRLMSIPAAAELGGLFITFCRYWADAESTYLGEIPEILSGLPFEWSVRWEGAVRGMLVLRFEAEFSNRLQRNASPVRPDLADKDLPREMASLYGAYIVHSFWADKFGEIGAIITRNSTPDDWPSRKPDSACLMDMDQTPVEIRLWVETNERAALQRKGNGHE